LAATLKDLAAERYRPPGADSTRKFSVPTLESWYYAYKAGSMDALRPEARSDCGRAQELTAEQRTLLCDIRREHPSASVPLILRTLTLDGRLSKDAVSASTVRRLFADEGLDRIPMRDGKGPKTRLRWEAERPGALWHGDVCYGPAISVDGKNMPVRIHGLLDDASRFIIALEAHHTEREVDMLGMFVRALRRHGPLDALYVDSVPRNRIDVLCPPSICGRPPRIAGFLRRLPGIRPHNLWGAFQTRSHTRVSRERGRKCLSAASTTCSAFYVGSFGGSLHGGTSLARRCSARPAALRSCGRPLSFHPIPRAGCLSSLGACLIFRVWRCVEPPTAPSLYSCTVSACASERSVASLWLTLIDHVSCSSSETRSSGRIASCPSGRASVRGSIGI
jgi:hypothetical protein